MPDQSLVNAVRQALADNRREVRLPRNDGRADGDTKAAVLTALIGDDDLHAGDIEVGVHGATVTLTGWVTSSEHHRAALAAAARAPGVARVHDELRLRAVP